MTASKWLTKASAVLLVVALLFVSGWYAWQDVRFYQDHYSNQREDASERDSSAVDDYLLCLQSEGVLSGIHCEYETTSARQDRKYSQYDLQAQQDMAVLTRAIMWIGIVGLGVSAFGLIALFITLAETRRGTKAAIDAVGIQANIERARVGIDTITHGDRITDKSYVLSCTFKNYGKTPAALLSYSLDFRSFDAVPRTPDYGNISSNLARILVAEEGESCGPIQLTNADGEVVCTPIAATDAQWQYVGKVVLFYGYFVYEDIFGKVRQTGFGYSFDALGIRTRLGSTFNYDKTT